jgi:Flp pilus assembly CpaF family ATPase
LLAAFAASDVPTPASAVAHDVYLRSYLEPFRPWLDRTDVSEILVAHNNAVSDEHRRSLPQTLDGLREAIAARQTTLVASGISSGKTTFLNALIKEIRVAQRIVTVEDTPEIRVSHPNSLGLIGQVRAHNEAILREALYDGKQQCPWRNPSPVLPAGCEARFRVDSTTAVDDIFRFESITSAGTRQLSDPS